MIVDNFKDCGVFDDDNDTEEDDDDDDDSFDYEEVGRQEEAKVWRREELPTASRFHFFVLVLVLVVFVFVVFVVLLLL